MVTELGGGSIRIHRRDIQEAMFKASQSKKSKKNNLQMPFSDIVLRLELGFNSTRDIQGLALGKNNLGCIRLCICGLALGLDRFAMLLAGKDNIREVIAFPKNSKASEPLTHAPSTVAPKQLDELYL